MPITIKDVARRAGVSVATASRALNGHPSASPGARQRVTDAARELNYLPNAQARSLRRTVTNTYGVIVSDVRNPFFAELAFAIEQAAAQQGCTVLLCNADENPERQDVYLETLRRQRVDGLIVVPQGLAQSGEPTTWLERTAADNIPMVFVDRGIDGLGVPTVSGDTSPGIPDAIAALKGLGHERIGVVAGPQGTSTGRDRLAAIRAALGDLPDDLLRIGDFRTESGAQGLDELLDQQHPPTAVLVADSPMTMGALGVLNRRGIPVGSGLSLVGYDDLDLFTSMSPTISTISVDVEELGRRSVDLLTRVIAKETVTDELIPSRFVRRDSVAQRKGS